MTSSLAPSSEAPVDTRSRSRLQAVIRGAATVLRFEFRKSRTWKRVLVWGAVSLFPPLIIFLMLLADEPLPAAAWIMTVFVMVCEMVVILNAMLWVAPIVQTELEGKTWLYVVTRPYGRFNLVIGKMLNGLGWTLAAGALSLALVGAVGWVNALPWRYFLQDGDAAIQLQSAAPVVYAQPQPYDPSLPDDWRDRDRPFDFETDNPFPEPRRRPVATLDSFKDAMSAGSVLFLLLLLSTLTYSSLFCGIGCIVPRRAMLITFSYTLIFEAVVAFVPAIINRLTIQYHLRCLLNQWIELDVPDQGRELFFSDWPAWWHVAVLCGMIVLWQTVSLVVIHFRQYVMTDEA